MSARLYGIFPHVKSCSNIDALLFNDHVLCFAQNPFTSSALCSHGHCFDNFLFLPGHTGSSGCLIYTFSV